MNNYKEVTLTDFMYKTVRRTGDIAELIFDNVDGKPVRLMGFQTEAWKDDYTVREEGYFYFLDLIIDTREMKKEKGQ